MTQQLTQINPDHFYRWSQGKAFFGYGKTQLRKRIAMGDVPAPVSLAAGGKTKGWYGRTIIAHQRALEDRAAQAQATAT